jgi:hypothetical protein
VLTAPSGAATLLLVFLQWIGSVCFLGSRPLPFSGLGSFMSWWVGEH